MPYFLATKIQAFLGRGNGEFDFSHDIEDILTVAAGANDLVAKVDASDLAVRSFLVDTLARWTHPTGPLTRSARAHFPGTPAGATDASRTLSLLREIAALPRSLQPWFPPVPVCTHADPLSLQKGRGLFACDGNARTLPRLKSWVRIPFPAPRFACDSGRLVCASRPFSFRAG